MFLLKKFLMLKKIHLKEKKEKRLLMLKFLIKAKKKKKKKSQVVMKTLEDCNKIQYISKRRKPSFYKKF